LRFQNSLFAWKLFFFCVSSSTVQGKFPCFSFTVRGGMDAVATLHARFSLKIQTRWTDVDTETRSLLCIRLVLLEHPFLTFLELGAPTDRRARFRSFPPTSRAATQQFLRTNSRQRIVEEQFAIEPSRGCKRLACALVPMEMAFANRADAFD